MLRADNLPYTAVTASDAMSTALITLRANDTLTQADVDMKLADIRHIPVVDDSDHLVGILSNRDVLRALGTKGERFIIVGDIMTTEVQTIGPSTSIVDAARCMLDYKIGALPVVGDEEQLVGLITESDLLRLAYDRRPY